MSEWNVWKTARWFSGQKYRTLIVLISAQHSLKRFAVIIWDAPCHHVSPVEAFSRLPFWCVPLVHIVLANTVIIVENSIKTWNLYSDHSIGICIVHHTVKLSSSDQILTPVHYCLLCFLRMMGCEWIFVAVELPSHIWLFATPWLQHGRPPCPSPSPGVCPSSLHWWCHPAISFSDTLFSSCPLSFSSSGIFPVSVLFTSDDQNTEASASTSVLLINIQGWFLFRLTGLVSLLSKGLSGVFSSSTVGRRQFFGILPSLRIYGYIHFFFHSIAYEKLYEWQGTVIQWYMSMIKPSSAYLQTNIIILSAVSLGITLTPCLY